VDNCLLSLSSSVLRLVVTTLFLPLFGFFTEKSETFKVLVKSNTARGELHDILSVSLADLLVFLRFENNQLLFFNPFSVDIGLLDFLLFIGVADFNTLALVVFLKGWSFRLNGLLLNNWLSGDFTFSSGSVSFRTGFFGTLLDIFACFELVLQVSNISPSSSFLSWSITK
jgi:hypothetical protein